MDTKEVAERIGTTPRVLRQFLRSRFSTFLPVGSGARYDFTERELGTLSRRFGEWSSAGKPRPEGTPEPRTPQVLPVVDKQRQKDEEVWAEEGPVNLPDIRDPRVRRRALADAHAAEDRLMLRLMAVGLHLTQLGDSRKKH